MNDHSEWIAQIDADIGDLKRRIEQLERPKRAPIPALVADLGLSVRTTNVLWAEGIETVDQLRAKSAKELIRLPGSTAASTLELAHALLRMCAQP